MSAEKSNKVVWRRGNVINVVRYDNTSNDKIINSGREKIVQTYHISRAQYEYIQANKGKNLQAKELTADNCLDCAYRGNGCYVNKGMQAAGMLSMVRAIVRQYTTWEAIPTTYNGYLIEAWCRGSYVRFGTYGEPVMLPYPLVASMADNARSYTGYTHAWRNPLYSAYSAYYMASTDSTDVGTATGWREFTITDNAQPLDGHITCPASKEGGYKSNCDKCALCSGTSGKGSKSVAIGKH